MEWTGCCHVCRLLPRDSSVEATVKACPNTAPKVFLMGSLAALGRDSRSSHGRVLAAWDTRFRSLEHLCGI